jgi:hypothetical protein
MRLMRAWTLSLEEGALLGLGGSGVVHGPCLLPHREEVAAQEEQTPLTTTTLPAVTEPSAIRISHIATRSALVRPINRCSFSRTMQ